MLHVPTPVAPHVPTYIDHVDSGSSFSFVDSNQYFFSCILPPGESVEPWPNLPPDQRTTRGDVEAFIDASNWDIDNYGPAVMTVAQLPLASLTDADTDHHFATPIAPHQVPGILPPSPHASDISREEFDRGLQHLQNEYQDIFDMTSPNISNFPAVQLGLKEEFKGRVFRRPERRKPPLVQQSCDIIDGQKILDAGYGFINNSSPHNINRVRVSRKDKDGQPLSIDRDRWCIDLSWVNHCLEDFDHPTPDLQDIIEKMTEFHYFSELDLKEAFNSLRITRDLSDILTFTTSQGKISYQVLPFGVKWGSSIFQWNMEEGFKDFLDTVLFLYVNNLIVHTNLLSTHLDTLRRIFQRCRVRCCLTTPQP
jgi:hypothetical protein